jgi:hypothetical protein
VVRIEEAGHAAAAERQIGALSELEREREAAIATMLAESDEFKEVATELSGDEQDETALMARLERLRMEFKVEMLEAEQRNHLAALKVADAIYHARYAQEVTLPF